MRKITQKELREILENHKHWLNEDCEGWERMKAYLSYVDLRGADLRGANLRCVNLSCADLSYVNLHEADLSDADLSYVNLRGANICDANLRRVDLRGAKNVPFIPYSCPDVGSFIGYKKARHGIVELEILSDARRCSATGRKCRCDKARVLGIYDEKHNLLDIKETVSRYDASFKYVVGEIVEEPKFCENRWDECSQGIHFFINFQEAVNYI